MLKKMAIARTRRSVRTTVGGGLKTDMKSSGAINSTCNWVKVQFQGSFGGEPLLYKGETRTVENEEDEKAFCSAKNELKPISRGKKLSVSPSTARRTPPAFRSEPRSFTGSSFWGSATVNKATDTKLKFGTGSNFLESAVNSKTDTEPKSVTKSSFWKTESESESESDTVDRTTKTKPTCDNGSRFLELATVGSTINTDAGSDPVQTTGVSTTTDIKSTSATGSDLAESATVVTTIDTTQQKTLIGSDVTESTAIVTTTNTKPTSVTAFDVSRTSTSDTFSTTSPPFVFGLLAGGLSLPTEINTKLSSQSAAKNCEDSQLLYELQTLEDMRYKFLEVMKTEKKTCSHAQDPFSFSCKCASINDTIEIDPETYDGHKKSVPHGNGVLKNSRQQVLYEGKWHNGKRSGKGSALIKDASASSTNANGFYTGEWTDNMRHGRGNMIFLSGAKYDGDWLYDKMHGVGKMKFPDGAVLEGVWCENKPQGCGIFTWPNGEREYREYRQNDVVLTGSRCKPVDEEVLGQRETDRLQLESEIRNLCRKLKEVEQKHEMKIEELEKQKEEEIASLKEQHKAEKDKSTEEFESEKSKLVAQHIQEMESATESKQVMQTELGEEKATKLCQICFDRQRDCILMPCLHFVYCRRCVNQHRDQNGNSAKCPACNTVLTGQLDCKLNL